ncbi:MAG: cell division protein FtsQ/DivIB [Streptococcus salivarius]
MFSLFFISPWSKQKVLTVSGTKNALPEDVKVASGILDTDYITHVFFNQGKVASTVEKTNVWVKKATVTYSFPNQFNIAVKEYPIVAYRQTTNGYVSILESGKTGGTVSTSNLPDKFITLKMDDEKKIEDLVKELNKLDSKIKNNIQIINLTPTKATSDLLTIELYDGNSIRVPLSQLTVKLPYYEKIKSQLSDGSIVDMEVGLYTTTPEVESSKTDMGIKRKIKIRLIK